MTNEMTKTRKVLSGSYYGMTTDENNDDILILSKGACNAVNYWLEIPNNLLEKVKHVYKVGHVLRCLVKFPYPYLPYRAKLIDVVQYDNCINHCFQPKRKFKIGDKVRLSASYHGYLSDITDDNYYYNCNRTIGVITDIYQTGQTKMTGEKYKGVLFSVRFPDWTDANDNMKFDSYHDDLTIPELVLVD